MTDARHALTIFAVADLGRSVRFYRDAFGWPARVDTPVYVELALPGGRGLGLYLREGFARNTQAMPLETRAGDITGTEIYIYCHDIDISIARLTAAGARALSQRALRDWGDEAAYFADPDGNVLVVARPAPDPAIEEVTESRSELCRTILSALPMWFGIPSAVERYIRDVETLPTYAACVAGERVGFVSLTEHLGSTTEIHVMGILPEHHGRGLGRKLVVRAEAHARSRGHGILTVKTVSASSASAEYARTRAFYAAVGFVPLEEFPTLWSAANPCLFLAKSLL